MRQHLRVLKICAPHSRRHYSSQRLFDTHCHIGLPFRNEDAAGDFRRAIEGNVSRMTVVGIDLATSITARNVARTLGNGSVVWSAGIHPNDASKFDFDMKGIESLATHGFVDGEEDIGVTPPRCAAIGETGMDFYRNRSTLEEQHRSLVAHLKLAKQLDLPVILHCRDAYAELLRTLKDFAPLKGVCHCFSSNSHDAMSFVELGLHISFAGPLTYPRSADLREACRVVPSDRIVVETDSPFLPPQRYRGMRNEPLLVRDVAMQVAMIRKWTPEATCKTLYDNSMRLFQLSDDEKGLT